MHLGYKKIIRDRLNKTCQVPLPSFVHPSTLFLHVCFLPVFLISTFRISVLIFGSISARETPVNPYNALQKLKMQWKVTGLPGHYIIQYTHIRKGVGVQSV
jgi:hypothetical protein